MISDKNNDNFIQQTVENFIGNFNKPLLEIEANFVLNWEYIDEYNKLVHFHYQYAGGKFQLTIIDIGGYIYTKVDSLFKLIVKKNRIDFLIT